MGQQYLHIYGVPGTVNPAMYPYTQLGQTIPGGQGYTTVQGYTIPGQQIMQYGGHNVNAITPPPVPTIQVPYPTGKLLFLERYIFSLINVTIYCMNSSYICLA